MGTRRDANVRGRVALAVLAVLTAVGCATPREPGREVESALAHYGALAAAMAHDSVAALFTETGALVTAGQPTIEGPAAIRTHLQSFVGFHILSNDLHTDTSRATGDSAYQAGTFRQRVVIPAGDTVVAQGRFSVRWVHDAEHGWRIRRTATRPS